jgi:4-phytase/acid phosphatase
MTPRVLFALTLSGLVLMCDPARAAQPVLERVVIVLRHGVRPPTRSAEALAPLADRAWPDTKAWGAEPGELTPHGAAAIRMLGADLRAVYARAGLIAAAGALDGEVKIWADGADQRTRETARALAEGLAPGSPPAFGAGPEGDTDPLFDALDAGACALDPVQAQAAVMAQAPLETAGTRAALDRLQAITAPRACAGGPGVCLRGEDKISGDRKGVKLTGPLGVGAGIAEDLLLEYENGLPEAGVGWGRAGRADLDVVLAAHVRASALTRRTPYIARRRAAPLARFLLAALGEGQAPAGSPSLDPAAKLIVLVGHDTNLSNLAGVFDLGWSLPGQPDATAPGTGLAFERWRDRDSGAVTLTLRIVYQDPDQVRRLQATPAHWLDLGVGGTPLRPLAARIGADLAAACPATAGR